MRNQCSMLVISTLLLLCACPGDAAGVLRDPTRPYSVKPFVAATAATFKVTAIFVSQKRRVAIVNGQNVTEGAQVDGATVVEILTDRLRLDLHGRELTARLRPAGLQE